MDDVLRARLRVNGALMSSADFLRYFHCHSDGPMNPQRMCYVRGANEYKKNKIFVNLFTRKYLLAAEINGIKI